MAFLAAIPAVLAGTASASAAASVATGMTMAGMAASAGGAIMGGIGSFEQANYQAKVASNQAKQFDQQSQLSSQAGAAEQSNKLMQVGELVGREKAIQGASGVDVNTGTPAELRTATQTEGNFDANTIRYNAMLKAYGEHIQSSNAMAQSTMDRASGRMALMSSFLSAAGSITGGLGKLGSMQLAGNSAGLGASAGAADNGAQNFFSSAAEG